MRWLFSVEVFERKHPEGVKGQGEGDSLVEYGLVEGVTGDDFEVGGDDCGEGGVEEAAVGVADVERGCGEGWWGRGGS